MRVLSVSYLLWKQVAQANAFAVYENTRRPQDVFVWAGDLDFVYQTHVGADDWADFEANFTSRTAVADEDEALAYIVGLGGSLHRSPSGVAIVMQEHREGSATDFLSPNWCDATTWFSSDARVENEAAADTGDGLTWSLVNSPIIDVSNGKITQEHRLRPDHGVVVTVDGATLTEKTKPNGMVGDYLVDYDGGTIRFDASQAGKDVRVTYCRSVDSVWTLAPTPGKRLRLTAVEVQFSTDIVMTTAVRFEFYGYAAAFAPQLGLPAGTKIPLGSPRVYQTMMDFINEAQRAFPDIPTMGGGDWRGTQHPTHVFRWPYAEDATRDLLASAGMEVRISLDGNTPLGGARAYATIYATSEDE